ncbi:MAG: universal stress protein [Thermodesulfobacteriota bacterium]
MSGFVVPIKEFSPLALASVRFAIEFGKRSNGRLFFLFVDDPSDSNPCAVEQFNRLEEINKNIKENIENMIVEGKENDGLQAEIHCRKGDFIQEVRQFVSDYHVNEIVLALPERHDQCYENVNRDVMTLLQLTNCRILTVRLKNKGI